MAQDTVDVLSKRDGMKQVHPTETLLLQGSEGWASVQSDINSKGSALGLAQDITQHLSHSYGTEAQTVLEIAAQDASLATRLIDDLPYIKAEVLYAVRNEMAMTPDDVLARRTSITLEDRKRGLGIVNEVGALMAKELGWSTEQQQSMIAAFSNKIERQLAAEQGTQKTATPPTEMQAQI
jgi:glycerol-3-phosphate dehydrogenase